MDYTKVYAVEAFCATCPTVQEVTNLLQALGFELAFNMGVDASTEYEQLSALPAQFHFQDKHGAEAIFLAGPDVNLDDIVFPEHASRFWLYPGADATSYWQVAHVLALTWSLSWRAESSARQHVA